MEYIEILFGKGEDMNALQMSLRACVVFIICLILIRVSGRRSFGMGMPVDNVTAILLGAILSRTVVGASEFIPTVAAATSLAILHRVCGWIGSFSKPMARFFKGTEIILYCNGKFYEENMHYGMITKEEILSHVRLSANSDSFDNIECVYLERNGQISVVKKKLKLKY